VTAWDLEAGGERSPDAVVAMDADSAWRGPAPVAESPSRSRSSIVRQDHRMGATPYARRAAVGPELN
jgi:hypothetical protein